MSGSTNNAPNCSKEAQNWFGHSIEHLVRVLLAASWVVRSVNRQVLERHPTATSPTVSSVCPALAWFNPYTHLVDPWRSRAPLLASYCHSADPPTDPEE